MQSRRIASTPLDGLIARGRAVDRDYAQLSGYLAAHPEIGDGAARLFAEPVTTRDGTRVDWYVEGNGRFVRADTLDAERQGAVLMRADTLLAAVRREGERLSASGNPMGASLLAVAETPTPLDRYVYVEEGGSDQPVLVCWGYEHDAAHRTGAAPQIMVARPDPTPPPAPEKPIAAPVELVSVPAVPTAMFRWWWPLWLLLALILLAIAWLLLRACGLGTPGDILGHGWRYCRPGAEALAEGVERGRKLDDSARQLELQMVQKRLVCVQNTPPPLPKDRWLGKDLAILEGCWSLGKDTQTLVVDEDGKQQQCTVKAGTICFKGDGTGTREVTTDCGAKRFSVCKAPVKARFTEAGALETEQPDAKCEPATITWHGEPNKLTCKRVDDNGALCRDHDNFEHEFKRKAN